MTTATTRLGRPNGDGKASSSSSESCHSSSHLPGNAAMTQHFEDDPHAVGQWLQFLQMEMYLQGFIDNGYDDFETIKQVILNYNCHYSKCSKTKLLKSELA